MSAVPDYLFESPTLAASHLLKDLDTQTASPPSGPAGLRRPRTGEQHGASPLN